MHQDIKEIDIDTHLVVHKEICTMLQTGEFWSMWDDELYRDALQAIFINLEVWKEHVPVGIA